MPLLLTILLQTILLALLVRQVAKTVLAMWTGYLSDVPFHQTSSLVADRVVKLVKDKEAEQFVELGSGDCRVSLKVVKKTSVQVTAVEKNWVLLMIARLKASFQGLNNNINFSKKDMFAADLTQADIVYLYLSTLANRQLKPKLETELKPGSLVISWKFKLESNFFQLNKNQSHKKLLVYTKTK